MNNQLDEYWHKIDVFQKNVLQKDYPKSYLKQSYSLYNTLKFPEIFKGEISTEDIFSCTNYEVKGNPFLINQIQRFWPKEILFLFISLHFHH